MGPLLKLLLPVTVEEQLFGPPYVVAENVLLFAVIVSVPLLWIPPVIVAPLAEM